LLEFEGVGRSFRTKSSLVHVLSCVDLRVRVGEVCGIHGSNGSGKTTLLHLAAGLLRPTWGRISCDDVEISGLSSYRLAEWRASNLGLVSATPTDLIAGWTVYTNAVIAQYYAKSAQAHLTPDVLSVSKQLGIADMLSKPVGRLSDGERRRVQYLRAVVSEPRVLLIDDPYAHIPSSEKDAITGLILSCSRNAVTIICSPSRDDLASFPVSPYRLQEGALFADS